MNSIFIESEFHAQREKFTSMKKQKKYALPFFLACLGLGLFLVLYSSKKPLDSGLSDSSINLYELLDSKIDDFLLYSKRSSIREARGIAETIKTQYQDDFGLDLVNYYSLTEQKQRDTLAALRTRLFQLETRSPVVEGEVYLQEANLITEGFLTLGNRLGYMRSQLLAVKYYSVVGKQSEMVLLTETLLQEARTKNYIFLQCHLLLWRGKIKHNKRDLLSVRDLASTLRLPAIYLSATGTLAGLYEISGDNAKAIEIAREALAKTVKQSVTQISLLQSFSIALAKEGGQTEALKQIDESITNAQEIGAHYSLGLSQIIKALILSSLNKIEESEFYLDLAGETALRLESNDFRYELLTMCSAYKAKNRLKRNQKNDALTFYHRALEQYARMEVKNSFVLAQLNEGVAYSTDNSVLSQYHLEAAGYNLLQAEINKDKKYSPFFNYN